MTEWNIAPKRAIEMQKRLAEKVVLGPLAQPPKTIAGADASADRFGDDLYAGMIVFSYPSLEPLDRSVVRVKASFPYIPGLLSFREIPGLLRCLEGLGQKPDLIMVDGQGIAHPRRLGIASHLGVLTGIPTIGCAKSRLYGAYREPGQVGETERILDPKTGETIGYALRSKARANPILVSPGYGIEREEALEIARSCIRGYRLPEPTRQAHILVNRSRRGEPL
ncbi:MAG: deoxyribonuclease V [Candidatus Taylorbacteria bacterium]|nr:deoxyribonuclease V [Candidatus Taylorbacteria bacterium]